MTTKLTKELRDKWIDALLSGAYEQGTSALRTADGKFCCLGVLCDIVDPSGWRDLQDGEPILYRGETSMPPENVIEAAPWADDLANRNDGSTQPDTPSNYHPHTFAEIAEIIRALPVADA